MFPTLPLETYCEVFSFLPLDYVLLVNWSCLMLYRVSQCLYRPLRRPFQPRVIEQLLIVSTEKRLLFQFADSSLRLLENTSAEKNSSSPATRAHQRQQSTYMRNANAKAQFQQWEIERMNAHICWPTRPFPSRFMPNISAPSDIVAIERICVELVENSRTNGDYSCTICKKWSVHCVILPFLFEL